MSRATIGRLVVRLYPREQAELSRDELVGTLLDAGDASPAAYVHQLISVLTAALWARARVELTRPLRRVAGSALCWLAVMTAMSQLVEVVGVRLYWGDSPGSDPQTVAYCYILPPLILALFTCRRNRIAGLLGLGWVAIAIHQHPLITTPDLLASVPLQTAGFVLLVARPTRQLPAGRFLWTVPAAIWLVYQVTLLGQLSGVGRVTPVLAALVLLPWAPALALGTAAAWALVGVYYVEMYQRAQSALWAPHLLVEAAELAAGVPLALLIAWIVRRAAARPQAARD